MRRNFVLIISFLTVTTAYMIVTPGKTEADGGCLPIYNGGATTQQFCPTPTPIPYDPSEKVTIQNGQPVYPSPASKTTPNTGPGDWTLLSLIAAGIVGLYIRKKTSASL